jgi:hypothetical protein
MRSKVTSLVMVTQFSGHRLNCVWNERGHENISYELFYRHRSSGTEFPVEIRLNFITTPVKTGAPGIVVVKAQSTFDRAIWFAPSSSKIKQNKKTARSN